MAAGAGTCVYQEPPPSAPEPEVVDHIAKLVYAVRDPSAGYPQDSLTGLMLAGIITQNEARRVVESWAETHAFPSRLYAIS